MSSTFAWYADAGLTAPLTRADFVRGSTPSDVNRVAYFGSPAAGRQLQAASDPGVDALQVAIVDASGGTDPAPEDVKLASSYVGLDSAVAGDPLAIGVTILSGAANAVAVYVRFSSDISDAGQYDDLSLRVSGWLETGV